MMGGLLPLHQFLGPDFHPSESEVASRQCDPESWRDTHVPGQCQCPQGLSLPGTVSDQNICVHSHMEYSGKPASKQNKSIYV